MLFDTSSPSRKRGVQVIFTTLALLMGGGLVFFGIGSATGDGGLASFFTDNQTQTPYDDDAKAAQEALDANPKDEAAAAKLAKARAQIAVAEAFDPTTGEINEDGGQELVNEATAAWTAYMKLGPAEPDAGAAMQYASFFALPTVAKYDQAARAIQAALVTRKPTSGLYAQLAIFQLVSGDTEGYQQARARALELAPNAERRTEIKKYLDDIKADIDEQQKQIAEQTKEASAETGGDSSAGTTPKLPTLPTLQ